MNHIFVTKFRFCQIVSGCCYLRNMLEKGTRYVNFNLRTLIVCLFITPTTLDWFKLIEQIEESERVVGDAQKNKK